VLPHQRGDPLPAPFRLGKHSLADQSPASVRQVGGEREPLLVARLGQRREPGAVLVVASGELRDVLPPKTWHNVWGRQEAALKQVFEECADHIEDACKTIQEQALTLNLPLGMRTEYDR
jgi:hypothetical protein